MASAPMIGGSGFLGRLPLKVTGACVKGTYSTKPFVAEKLGTGRGSTSS
jgi:hypothetical protein